MHPCVHIHVFVCVCSSVLCRNITTALSFVCGALQTNNISNASLETIYMLLKMDMTFRWPEPFPLSSQNLSSFQLPQPLNSTHSSALLLGTLLLSISFPPSQRGGEVFALSVLGSRR